MNFIRKLIKVSILLDTNFTRAEKALVRNNKKFTLNKAVSEESEDLDLRAALQMLEPNT